MGDGCSDTEYLAAVSGNRSWAQLQGPSSSTEVGSDIFPRDMVVACKRTLDSSGNNSFQLEIAL